MFEGGSEEAKGNTGVMLGDGDLSAFYRPPLRYVRSLQIYAMLDGYMAGPVPTKRIIRALCGVLSIKETRV